MSTAAAAKAPGIACVTDRRLAGDRPLADVARAAIAGGVEWIQVREKDLGAAALLALAREIVEAAKAAGGRARVLVNGRLDVALAAKAAGVHLPADGLPVAAVRRVAGRRYLVGRSVHSLGEARQAEKDGADYLFFGPVFATPAKAAFGEPQGTAALARIAEAVRIPVWAIGGVNPDTAPGLRGLPIAGVAAITAIVAAPDPAEAVRALRAALGGSGAAAAEVTRRESSRR